jgi:hypothetical protein
LKEHSITKLIVCAAGGTVQFMHQTVREFIIRAVPRAANLKFEISDEAANRTIATTLARYLMLCFTSPTMRDRFTQIMSWSPDEYRTYAEYLNEWPLIEYALLSIKECRCGQDASLAALVTATAQKLTENQATYFVGSFLALHAGRNDGQAADGSEYRTTSQDIEYRTLNAAAKPALPYAVRALLTCTQEDGYAERKTPLIISAQKGLPAATLLFLDQNVDVNATDNIGRTALHFAAQNTDEIIVRLLVDRGAKKGTQDGNGVFALELAIDNSYNSARTPLPIIT